MSRHRGGSRRMYARFVTVLSGGRADNARPCVPKWRFQASVIRRGSAERPRDNSPRPCAESGLDMVNRYMVFQDAAPDGASLDVILRDANDRRWLTGPAPALPSTGAITIATTAKKDGQLGECADSNERGRRVGGAGQESRAVRSLRFGRADRIGLPVLKRSRIACRVPSGDLNVNDFARTRYWRGTTDISRLSLTRRAANALVQGLATRPWASAAMPRHVLNERSTRNRASRRYSPSHDSTARTTGKANQTFCIRTCAAVAPPR
jgi:hypothetical protein